MQELRCKSKMHGVILDADTIEFKCNSRFCGARPGRVVLHQFSNSTGELLSTKVFRDPAWEGRQKGSEKSW